MNIPESIRLAYLPQPNESREERKKRLTNRRAAKYRYKLKCLNQSSSVNEVHCRRQWSERQKRRREKLDIETKNKIREANRLRQRARRERMTEDEKDSVREKQKLRARQRRQQSNGNEMTVINDQSSVIEEDIINVSPVHTMETNQESNVGYFQNEESNTVLQNKESYYNYNVETVDKRIPDMHMVLGQYQKAQNHEQYENAVNAVNHMAVDGMLPSSNELLQYAKQQVISKNNNNNAAVLPHLQTALPLVYFQAQAPSLSQYTAANRVYTYEKNMGSLPSSGYTSNYISIAPRLPSIQTSTNGPTAPRSLPALPHALKNNKGIGENIVPSIGGLHGGFN